MVLLPDTFYIHTQDHQKAAMYNAHGRLSDSHYNLQLVEFPFNKIFLVFRYDQNIKPMFYDY